MNNKFFASIFTTVFVAISSFMLASPATANILLNLPDPEDNAVLYGDFYSYSAPIMDYFYPDGNGSTRDGSAFEFDDTLSNIKEELNVISASAGAETFDQPTGSEDAYDGYTGDMNYYMTSADAPEPGGDNTYDNSNWWDVDLDAFLGFLEQEDDTLAAAILVFNNNEQDDQSSQTLQAFFQVIIWDGDASDGTETPIVFTFQNYCPIGAVCESGGYIWINDGTADWMYYGGIVTTLEGFGDLKDTSLFPSQPIAVSPDELDYVTSGGDICLLPDGSLTNDPDAPGAVCFAHNLGADRMSYMLYSDELNATLLDFYENGLDGYTTLSVNFFLGCDTDEPSEGADSPIGGEDVDECYENEVIDNGSERAFWSAGIIAPPEDMPEPGILSIVGFGLLSLYWIRRRAVV